MIKIRKGDKGSVYIVSLAKDKKGINERAYYYSALEQETREWENEKNIPFEERNWRESFGWFKYYGKI